VSSTLMIKPKPMFLWLNLNPCVVHVLHTNVLDQHTSIPETILFRSLVSLKGYIPDWFGGSRDAIIWLGTNSDFPIFLQFPHRNQSVDSRCRRTRCALQRRWRLTTPATRFLVPGVSTMASRWLQLAAVTDECPLPLPSLGGGSPDSASPLPW
jgi:hypothetical protein